MLALSVQIHRITELPDVFAPIVPIWEQIGSKVRVVVSFRKCLASPEARGTIERAILIKVFIGAVLGR